MGTHTVAVYQVPYSATVYIYMSCIHDIHTCKIYIILKIYYRVWHRTSKYTQQPFIEIYPCKKDSASLYYVLHIIFY